MAQDTSTAKTPATEPPPSGAGDNLGARIERHLRDHKLKYILQGIGFIIAGILAVMLSGTTALHTEFVIGIALLMTGMLQLALTLTSKMHWWSLLSAALSIATGLLILWKPFAVLMSIVMLLAVFMTLESLFELFLALRFRPLRNWGWMIFSSAATFLMAIILWIGYPAFDLLYLGWIVAVNFVLYGLALLMLVWSVAS